MHSLSKPFALLPLLLCGTMIPCALLAQTQTPPQKPGKGGSTKSAVPLARKGRDTKVIDGAWRFRTDPQNIGEQESWSKAPPADAKEIAIPSLWTTQSAPGYSGVAWYWREFDVSPSWKTQTVRLRFEAVAEKSSVWLNGIKLGDHEGGATPFEFNVTKEVHAGAKNIVAVRVEGDAKKGAGIWQGVVLMAHDEAYLSEVALTAGGLGQLSTAITFENTSENSGVATLDGRLITPDKPDKDVHHSEQNLSLTPGRNVTTLLTSIRGKALRLWSPDSPTLYAMQLAFRQGPDVLDTQQTTFGFREFGWKNNSITLNGLPLKMMSVAPTFPLPIVVASTEDADRARASVQKLKDSGVTILFLDAPPPELLRIADEVGMLVVEAPRPGQPTQVAVEELKALMTRDRSHPCVMAWRLRDADATELTALRTSDPSRFVLVGARGAEKLYTPGDPDKPEVAIPDGFLPKS